MSTTSDFNMLRLEAHRNLLQITKGANTEEEVLELRNPTSWVRTLVRWQEQAERDLQQLVELCGGTVDRSNRRIRDIETAYYTLGQGTRYVYERVQAGENIAEEWVRNELVVAANAYQSFAQDVWKEIIVHTQSTQDQQFHQATQLARVNDAVAFLPEANLARSQHLAVF